MSEVVVISTIGEIFQYTSLKISPIVEMTATRDDGNAKTTSMQAEGNPSARQFGGKNKNKS